MKKIISLFLLIVVSYGENITKNTQLYIGSTQNTPQKLLQDMNKFTPTKLEHINIGYDDTNAVWLKFDITNNSDQTIEKTIYQDSAIVDESFLYTLDEHNNIIDTIITGVAYRLEFDYLIGFHYRKSIAPHSTAHFLLKVASQTSSVHFSLHLLDYEEFVSIDVKKQFINFAIFGGLVALLIYNFANFIFTRDTVFLYYSFYLFSAIWNQVSMTSLVLHFMNYFGVISQKYVDFERYFGIFNMLLFTIGMIMFTKAFLATKQYPKIDKLLTFIILIMFATAMASTHNDYLLELMITLNGFVYIALLGVGIYALTQKNQFALVYVIGWGILLGGIISAVLYHQGYLNSWYTAYPYTPDVTILIEAFIFSFALANKINIIGREKERVAHALETKETLIREIHHRVKNNMQTIISVYQLKLKKHLTPQIKQSTKEAEQTIKAMSTLHEILYNQDDIVSIDGKAYLERVIEHIKKGFDLQGVTIEFEYDAKLTNEELMVVAIILNELITNSAKYAFDKAQGVIKISIKTDKNTTLLYSDSGDGFDDSLANSSFGLRLISLLVENQFDSKLNKINKNSFQIIW